MKKRFSAVSLGLVALLVAGATFLITSVGFYKLNTEQFGTLYEKEAFYDKLQDIYDWVDGDFIGEYSKTDLEDNYIRAFVDGLGDPYSSYMSKQEYDAYMKSAQGNLVGIGVHAIFDQPTGGIYIVGVMPDSPAQAFGVEKGDIIVQVEDVPLSDENYEKAVNTIRGHEGETVNLIVKRQDELIKLSIIRATVEIETVVWEIIPHSKGNIAYLKIYSFDKNTPKGFDKALANALEENCVGYIFDVRGNPGGDLDSIVSVLDSLLPEGPIIKIVDKDGNITKKDSDPKFLDAPMAVLVNENTASAAELFAAALKDYELATLVGTTTFGKGSMQTIISLPDGSGLRLSTNYYNPPFSDNYNGIGVDPHITVELTEEQEQTLHRLDKNEDPQFIKAIDILTK